mmetsp:Transcript_104606/g.145812  ORF Transcript_104606/g.145812 Transcript_104606/m.145812 type:complete len:256 (-) Transcript_104606:147-914(-)
MSDVHAPMEPPAGRNPGPAPADWDRGDQEALFKELQTGVAKIMKLRPPPASGEGNHWVFVATGFLYLTNKRIMTNAHVADVVGEADPDHLAAFFRTPDSDGSLITVERRLTGGVRVSSDPSALDYCTCELTEPCDEKHHHVFQPWEMVPLRGEGRSDEPAAVLHHPRGRFLTMSVIRKGVPLKSTLDRRLQYSADPATEPGSSGGPVVNRAGKVVALHCTGDGLPGGKSGAVYIGNIIRDMGQHAAAVAARGGMR